MSITAIIFSTLIAPILVGVTLTTYKYWLDNRKRWWLLTTKSPKTPSTTAIVDGVWCLVMSIIQYLSQLIYSIYFLFFFVKYTLFLYF